MHTPINLSKNKEKKTKNHSTTMATIPVNPRVGIAALITNAKGELITGKRAGSHGAGMYYLLNIQLILYL
jgi:hypothetical protein